MWTHGLALTLAIIALPMTAAAQSDPADLARIAALEARLAALEARLAVDDRNLTLGAEGTLRVQTAKTVTVSAGQDMTVTSGKTLSLSAGDDIVIQTGKAKLIMRKNGVVELSGTDITINAERLFNARKSSDVVVKDSKIGQN